MTRKTVIGLFFAAFLAVSAAPALEAAGFSYGGALRLRQEYWGDAFDFGTGVAGRRSENFLRLKASLWGRLDIEENLALYLRLTSEPRFYFQDRFGDSSGWSSDELFIDNLYLDWKEIAGLPLDLRLGRQDFLGVFGEGFLVMDGATLAGSRAFYFNAARATWRVSDDNALDFVYLNNQETDKYLPVINNKGQALNRSGEWAAMLYSRNRVGDSFSIDPYFIYKREHAFGANPELALKTLGAHAAWQAAPWRFRAQVARQFGDDRAGNDHRGTGGYLFADHDFGDAPLTPQVTAGFAYLSGNDRNTGKNEGWNPLFSRFPWISDAAIFPYAPEKDIAYWTNLQLYRAGVRLNFTPDTALQLNYNYLRANETMTGHPLDGALFGDGKGRGHLPQATLSHRFSPALDGLLQWEYFLPGSFYVSEADRAVFFRWQLQYRF